MLIPWPWASQDGDPDDDGPMRRRPSEIQRWLPTIYFVAAAIGVLTVLFLLITGIASLFRGSPSSASAPVGETAPIVEIAPAPPAIPTVSIRYDVRQLQPSYTVVAGDSLSAIAHRYGTTADALKGINNLSDDAILGLGQRLIIP